MSDDVVEIDDKVLKKLIKSIGADKTPIIKVGILGNKNSRGNDANGNASIGAKHEYGTSTMPERSFLRMPLSKHLGKSLENSGLFDKNSLDEVLKSGSLVPLMKKISIVAEDTVLEAFATGGYGEWKPSNMALKKNHQTLVETQQLRNSITAVVEE